MYERIFEYFPPNIVIHIWFVSILKAEYSKNIFVWIFLNIVLLKSMEILELKEFCFHFHLDNIINSYDNFMLVCKLLKHRASTQNVTFYVISENFSFFHCKIIWKFLNILNYLNIFYSTNNIRYLIQTIWQWRIIRYSIRTKIDIRLYTDSLVTTSTSTRTTM